MADNDSDDCIYVDVKARLDASSADEVESKLKDKLKNVTHDIGDSLRDATKSIGDYFDKDIKDSVKDYGRNLRDEIKSGDIRSAIDDINRTVKGSTDSIKNLGEAFGMNLGGVDSISKSIADVLGPLGQIGDKVKPVHDAIGGLKSDIEGTVAGFGAFSAGSGRFASALETVGKAAGPVALAMSAIAAADPKFGSNLDKLITGIKTHDMPAALKAGAGLAGDSARDAVTMFGFDPNPLALTTHTTTTRPRIPGAYESIEGALGKKDPGQLLLGGTSGGPAMVTAKPGESPVQTIMGAITAPPISHGGAGAASISAQQATVSASSATVMAGSVNLGGLSLPSGAGLGRAPSISAPTAIPGAHSWFSSGGVLPGPSPGHDNMLGSLGGKPIGLEGGEFVVNPGATHDYLPLLKAINSGGMPHFDAGGGPLAPPNQPAQPAPPTSGNQGGQGPTQQQQIGTGQGIGVTGGGAIGAAESMASMFPGAGVAMAEANLAIKKGGQMLATLAMAPIETMWLGGGQLGAPSVGSPAKAGWMGKLLGGMIGQTTNIPNIAGAVQPPKQPDQPGEQGDIHQQGGPNQAPNPSGTKDDPSHVKIVGGGQPPPQGAATSHSNMQSPMHSQMTA